MNEKEIAKLKHLEEHLGFCLEFAKQDEASMELFARLGAVGAFWANSGLASTADKLAPLMSNQYRFFALLMPVQQKVRFAKEYEAHFGKPWIDEGYAIPTSPRSTPNESMDWWTTELNELRGYINER